MSLTLSLIYAQVKYCFILLSGGHSNIYIIFLNIVNELGEAGIFRGIVGFYFNRVVNGPGLLTTISNERDGVKNLSITPSP